MSLAAWGGTRRPGTTAPCSLCPGRPQVERRGSRAPSRASGAGAAYGPAGPARLGGLLVGAQAPPSCGPERTFRGPEVRFAQALPSGGCGTPGSHMQGQAQSLLGTRRAKLWGQKGGPQKKLCPGGGAVGRVSHVFRAGVPALHPSPCLVTQTPP